MAASKYNLEIATKLANSYSLGMRIKSICEANGLNEQTWYNWKEKHIEFFELLKNAIIKRDETLNTQLEETAYKAAIGYDVTETKMVYKYDEKGNETLVSKDVTTKHIYNPTMNMFMLVNRMPEKYQSINKEKITDTGNSEIIDKLLDKIASGKNE